MTARIVHVVNPAAPLIGARIFEVEGEIGALDALARAHWRLPAKTILYRDGCPVKRAAWNETALRDGETAVLVSLPGNKGGSAIIAMIAEIALMVLAPQIALMIAPELVGVDLALLTTAIVIAGKLLISALTPKPKTLSNASNQSPTYSLGAQSNQARLAQMIPEHLGLFEHVPDLAAAPWSEFKDDQQLLHQLFNLGMGGYEISQVSIGDNPIWKDGDYTGTFPEITLEFVPPGAAVTLFDDNVVTSQDVSSITMLGTNQQNYGMLGPFVLSKPGTTALAVEVDIECPEGLNNSGDDPPSGATVEFLFQAQLIDNTGAPIGSFFDVIDVTLQLAQRNPTRRTYRFDFPTSGRYWVQGQRTNAKATDGNVADLLVWASLRAVLPSRAIYPGCTMMAMTASSDANLNSANADQIKVVKTRKLRTWDAGAGAWTDPVATRSIAWAALYIATSENGGNLPDSRIDTDKLIALDATWASRGDYFDGVYDSQESLLEAIQAVLTPGRTRMIMVGSTMSFVRDEPRTVPRTAFTPRSILPKSLSVNYQLFDPNSVESLAVTYVDSRTWQPHTVLCKFDDSDDTIETATPLQFFGITDYAHAWREGISMVAANKYRRRGVSFQTELEGRVCGFGDLVSLSHYMPNWGFSADVVDLLEAGDGDVLTLSEPYTVPAGQEGEPLLIGITTPDGQVWGPTTCETVAQETADPRTTIVKLTGSATVTVGKYAGDQPRDWPVWSNDGQQLERPRATLGQGTVAPRDALITKMTPDDTVKASVQVIIDDPRVYTADAGDPPDDPYDPSATVAINLIITSVTATEGAASGGHSTVTLTISGAPDATGFYVNARTLYSGTFGVPVYFPGAPVSGHATVALPLATGATELLIIAGCDIGLGQKFLFRLTVDGTNDTAPANVGSITTTVHWSKWTKGAWNWADVTGALSYIVQVQHSPDTITWSVARTVEVDASDFTYYLANSMYDNGPFNNLRIGVKAKNGVGTSSTFTFSSVDP